MKSDGKRKGNKQIYTVCMCARASQKREEEVESDCRSFALVRRLYICYQRTRNGERVLLLPKNESNGSTSREVVVDVNMGTECSCFHFPSFLCLLTLSPSLLTIDIYIHTYIYILVFICSSILDVAVFFSFVVD